MNQFSKGVMPTRNFSPQNKLQAVTDKMGLPGLKYNQGTTVVKYDTLPADGRTVYNFFQEANTRPFPLSNTGTDGGKLGVGESLVIQRVSIAIAKIDTETKKINSFSPLDLSNAGLIDGELTIVVANSNVLLRLPILQFLPEFNKNAENSLNTSYEFDTLLVIPPQLDYTIQLRCSGITDSTALIRLTIEGVGSIFAPRTTL